MNKKLMLSPDKKITGLCAGIGDYLNIDPTLIRLIVVAIALLTAILPAFIVYLILSLVFPAADETYYQTHPVSYRRLHKSYTNKRIAGVCGGIAETYNKSATTIRLIWALTFIFFGYGLFLYIGAAILMPHDDIQPEGNVTDAHFTEN